MDALTERARPRWGRLLKRILVIAAGGVVAAVALLLLTLLSVMVGLIGFATGSGRFNPFVPLVLVGRLAVSIRIVYTTFKLNAYADANIPQLMPPLPPAFHNEEGSSQWAQPV